MSIYNEQSIQGTGIGLRMQHFDDIANDASYRQRIPWLEALSDNYMQPGSVQREYLNEFRRDYPVTFHGVGMSLGSTDPLNQVYLQRLKALVDEIQPAWVSDHLCWTSVHQMVTHDLIPLPYTEETIKHVGERILQVQDYLKQQLVIENVSSYLQYQDSQMTEWEFVNAVIEYSDCALLLDVNNIYVSARNHEHEAMAYVDAIPVERVRQIHLAGYEDKGTHLLDTHSRPVSDGVWELFEQTLQHVGDVPVLIEWDNDVPTLDELLGEADKAEAIRRRVMLEAAA